MGDAFEDVPLLRSTNPEVPEFAQPPPTPGYLSTAVDALSSVFNPFKSAALPLLGATATGYAAREPRLSTLLPNQLAGTNGALSTLGKFYGVETAPNA